MRRGDEAAVGSCSLYQVAAWDAGHELEAEIVGPELHKTTVLHYSCPSLVSSAVWVVPVKLRSQERKQAAATCGCVIAGLCSISDHVQLRASALADY